MGKSIGIPLIILRFKGVFDMDGLYAAVTSWAKNYEYIWHERDYKHKVPVPTGAEQEMKWDLEKTVTEYIRYDINMHVHMWDIKDKYVEENGRKKKLTTARIQITMRAKLTTDWQNIFKGSKFIGKLGDWYRDIFIRKDIESKYWDTLYYRVWNLHAVIKKYLEMQDQKYAYKGYLGEN